MATLVGNKIIESDKKMIDKLEKRNFGKILEDGNLELSLIEGLFLLENEKIEIIAGREKINFLRLIELASREDTSIKIKYQVYKDLRERGYIVKTGYKFGSHFRVYERGADPTKEHSKYLVHVLSEGEILPLHDFSRAVRLSHGVRKFLILAVVDDEGDISYYKFERITP
ncbi:MAG: tRNA-intron lyase [Candidatus Hydrothermarchaeota archaeon]